MIISRTPLRVSFVGGGSDLPAFYREEAGAVVSMAVDKYVYITVNPKFDAQVRVSYSHTEEVPSVDQLQHPLVRESLRLLGITGGVEITSIADIPSRGTGLGSSSAFTVGLLHALHAFQGHHCSSQQLAQESCDVELNRCAAPIGKQDQYAAAFGGFNYIQFLPDETVSVQPLVCRPDTLQALQDRLLIFYTGITRSAGTILRDKQEAIATHPGKRDAVRRMAALAGQLFSELRANRIDALGAALHENWQLKRSLSDHVSTGEIDDWYDRALRHGATGGKLLGAGAGGFLLFDAPPERHPDVVRALAPLRRVPMRCEALGSRIIFVHH